ncbi:MAG TPA: hypothetical protein VK590_02315, partial [Saprospiraceae bacterium]|nr:hypothetical protein [Saprospiraceae bacterium]
MLVKSTWLKPALVLVFAFVYFNGQLAAQIDKNLTPSQSKEKYGFVSPNGSTPYEIAYNILSKTKDPETFQKLLAKMGNPDDFNANYLIKKGNKAESMMMACSIDGPATVCPGSSTTFSTTDPGPSYDWELSPGTGGVISGPNTLSSVIIVANNNCNTVIDMVLITSSAICIRNISVLDNTSPIISSCPANQSISMCNPTIPSPDLSLVVATDNCTNITNANKSYADVVTNTGCNYTDTRTFTVTDNCGNTATCAQVFTYVVDLIAPMVSCPSPAITELGCTSTVPPSDLDAFTATDNCGGTLNNAHKSVNNVVTNSGCYFTTTRTYTATDDCGNSASCTQLFHYKIDVTPPVLVSCPAGGSLPCNSTSVPPANLSAFVVT